jgi:hypothetical protein
MPIISEWYEQKRRTNCKLPETAIVFSQQRYATLRQDKQAQFHRQTSFLRKFKSFWFLV